MPLQPSPSLRRALPRGACSGALVLGAASLLVGCAPAKQAADTVYTRGVVYTADAQDSMHEAVAVRDGTIVFVGSSKRAAKYVGPGTEVVDLGGRMVMPGLVDAHMHPLLGGAALSACDLKFEPLTLQQFQARIQACLDAETDKGPGDWLRVTSWYRQAMVPVGTDATAATLDALNTTRPIAVGSSDYHTLLANTRAMQLAAVTAATPDPAGGHIARGPDGQPTGIFEDAAMNLVTNAIPPMTLEDDVRSASLALEAMAKQGVTTFVDAWALETDLNAFSALQKAGKLTARAYFAPPVTVEMAKDPDAAVQAILALRQRFHQGPPHVAPTLSLSQAKIFMDGVAQAPAQTAGLLAPYLENHGTEAAPDWVPGTNLGEVYFAPVTLEPLVVKLGLAGIDPHVHAIGDRAVRGILDAFAAMRAQAPGKDLRPAIAHAEIVDPADYGRFAQLDVTPVMSFQWAKPAPDSIDATKDYLGPERFSRMEPEGSLFAARARVTYGSDWPVDPLDEWFALKVGITRRNRPDVEPKYQGTLNAEAGLSRLAAIRAITTNAAYQLHLDHAAGSLEVGKLADLIVLDRNYFTVPEEDIANIKVLRTVVGGKTVYQAPDLR